MELKGVTTAISFMVHPCLFVSARIPGIRESMGTQTFLPVLRGGVGVALAFRFGRQDAGAPFRRDFRGAPRFELHPFEVQMRLPALPCKDMAESDSR
jgi:hypothetical protein